MAGDQLWCDNTYLLQSYGGAGEVFSDEEIMSGKFAGVTLM